MKVKIEDMLPKTLFELQQWNIDHINKFVKLIQDGIIFPKIRVVRKGSKFQIVDGQHRYYAYKQLGYKEIEVLPCVEKRHKVLP